jgi:threonyl-tRNA synthetase
MVNICLKDGSVRSFDGSVSGKEVAQSISTTLAENAVLCRINGIICDLSAEITQDSSVEILTIRTPETLEVLRHSAAHIMAKAVKELFLSVKIAVGPVIEDGFFYDFESQQPFTLDDLAKIEEKMHEIVSKNIPFEKITIKRSEAIKLFEDIGEKFKVEILKEIDDETVSLYKLDDLHDLCRGPHVPSTKFIGKAFKIIKVSGAYWKGDQSRESLQRITGTAWATKEDLDAYFLRKEEAEKRDHRKLGVELDLFHMQDISPGAVFWHTKGWTLYRTLKNFVREKMQKCGYEEVNTPMLVDRVLWERSGHWDKFKENMFVVKAEDEQIMAIKPMNCPCHVQIFNRKIVSYRDLPWRIAEFGSCHRYEPSGALHGIMRVRGFVQDDAHIFCTPEQIIEETKSFCALLREIYKAFGFNEYSVKFSDRPAKRAGTDEIWDLAEKSLKEAATAANLEYSLNPGEGAFYGPKLEFVLKDCLGRDWQCGTLQVDFVLPERLGAEYITDKGERKYPVMLHRAVLGSIERFIGILIEHYAGKFPVWLAPVQAVVATITEDANDYAKDLLDSLKKHNIRAEIDIRNEKISYKIREHSAQKIPYILVIGKNEMNEQTISVRTFGFEESKNMNIEEFIKLFDTN